MTRTAKIVAAAAIGFAAGILLAPKSGKETREDIKRKALGAKDYASDKAGDLKEMADEAGKTLRKSAKEVGGEAIDMLQSARKSGEEVADEAKTRANRAINEAKKAGERVRKDAEKRLR